VTTYTVNAANTWEQKSVTLTIDSTTGSFAKDSGQGLFIGFGLAARAGGSRETSALNQWVPGGTAYVASTANRTDFISTVGATIRIAQVKLSIGSQVTDFSTRGETIGDELMLCQRYYEKSYPINTVPGTAISEGIGRMIPEPISGGLPYISGPIKFFCEKRATPVILIYGSDSGTLGVIADAYAANSRTVVTVVNPYSTGFSELQLSTNPAADVVYEFNYTADAEL
jgi:hypothetical protein